MFSQSFEGAKATAIIMSLLETAKRHQLNSEKYLSYLLEYLPNEETLVNKEVLEAYLPWNKVCYKKSANKKSPDQELISEFSSLEIFQYTSSLGGYE